jgi:RND family efflux transporter MFP subunit
MGLTRKHLFIVAGLLIVGVGAYFGMVSRSEPAPQQARNTVQVVKTALAEKKTIPLTVVSNGYVTAINTVDVRPQVQNIVKTIHVTEGQEVRPGQLLFTLDDRSDLANVDKAKAQLARDRADLADAEMTLKRNQELLAKNFISQAVVDTARSKVASLHSTVQADMAAVQSSNVALSYNRITSSIGGRIGAISVHPGSLAQPTGTPMVTISQLDPIAVSFSIPERELFHIRASYPKGDAPVIAQLTGNQEMRGKLIFIDNTIDPQSGTIRMKAEFANSKHLMWPGAFINVRLISRTLPDVVVIPVQAIVTGPSDKLVYIVQPDSSVKSQRIDVAAIENGEAAVSGLPVGTRIVVEGSQNLRPNSKVKEVQAAPASADQAKRDRI